MDRELRCHVLRALREGDVDSVDEISRRMAEETWKKRVSGWDEKEVLSFIDRVTGGLGYKKERPLDVVDMVWAGTYIAWPEAVRDGYRVLEVGTGLGRTCYVIHRASKPELYVTIDNSPEMLAIALFSDVAPQFREVLWLQDVKIVLADAVEALRALLYAARLLFDHFIHDGGPNPLKNPRLYTSQFMVMVGRKLRCGATASVFAGKSRLARNKVYESLREAGFTIVGTVTLPESTALVFRASWTCSSCMARRR